MAQPSKEPCKKEACDIQSCLSKNNFLPQRSYVGEIVLLLVRKRAATDGILTSPHLCQKVIENLQSCCEKCDYKSTHCGSVSALLKQIHK